MTTQKYALITGCSSGIGKALAVECHSRGMVVFAGARRLAAMEDLAQKGIHTFELDVTDEDSIQAMKSKVIEIAGNRLDFLFNNAGQSCTIPGAEVKIEDVNRCFDVNFNGVIRMIQAYLPLLLESKGKIVQTGSVAGAVPFPWGSVYGATKAAVRQYSESLRLELKPFGVDVVTIVTGGVNTNIADTRPLPAESQFKDAESSFEMRRQLAVKNKPISPEKFAKQVISSVDKTHAPEHVWHGSNAGLIQFALYYLPRRVLLFMILRRFVMFDYYQKVKARLLRK